MAWDGRYAMLVLAQLGGDEIDGSGGKMVAALVDPREVCHAGSPIVNRKPDVCGDIELHALEPAWDVGVEGNKCVRLVSIYPVHKSRMAF